MLSRVQMYFVLFHGAGTGDATSVAMVLVGHIALLMLTPWIGGRCRITRYTPSLLGYTLDSPGSCEYLQTSHSTELMRTVDCLLEPEICTVELHGSGRGVVTFHVL